MSKQSITTGNARFQVLSPTLVRIEYSSTGTFIDAPTVSVLNREDWPAVDMQVERADGWLNIDTGRMQVSYREESGPFSADNLTITWEDHAWRPGDPDDANLGGVPPTMDGVSTPVTAHGALSRKGHFLLDDSRSPVRDAETEWIAPRAEKDAQDWYFFSYGTDYPAMLRELSRLLGPIPMTPRYMLGAWFTSRAAYAQNQWEMIANRFRDEGLPLDIFVLDSLSWTNVVWAGYDWDYEQLPDPPGFFRWAREHGIKVSMNEHYAALTPENDQEFETIRREMGLPEDTKEIAHDLADKRYARLYIDLLLKRALDAGMSFWWQDGWAGANMEGLDPAMWTREVEYLGTERVTGKRAFVFCRLGSAWGTHRYGSYFTGDMVSNWPTLELKVDAAVKAGNMLVAWVNHDAGAIFGTKLDDELYQRWIQFAAFSPIFRLHSIWGLRLPWEYGPEGVECYRKFLGLRYALIPYLYTYARLAHDTGLPLARGMYLEYPDQENSYRFPLQYLFGSELLAAPVTRPSEGRPSVKDVFLPAGECWYDYFTGRIYEGGQVISYECPLDRMPLFVRAGSILPMAPAMDYSDQKPVDPLTLDVYAGKAARFRLYEDGGDSLDYRSGEFAWTDIRFEPDESGDCSISIGPAEGSFRGLLPERRYRIRVHGLLKPDCILVNGVILGERMDEESILGWSWDRHSCVLSIALPDAYPTSHGVQIVVKGAGTFADRMAFQRVTEMLGRVRKAKFVEKLKYATALNSQEHAKPPRVIRRTEEIEQALIDLAANPRGLAGREPDYADIVDRLTASFTDQPFESQRTIPDLNETCRNATQSIANVAFSPEELQTLRDILHGPYRPETYG